MLLFYFGGVQVLRGYFCCAEEVMRRGPTVLWWWMGVWGMLLLFLAPAMLTDQCYQVVLALIIFFHVSITTCYGAPLPCQETRFPPQTALRVTTAHLPSPLGEKITNEGFVQRRLSLFFCGPAGAGD